MKDKEEIRKFQTILYNCGSSNELILSIMNKETRKKLFNKEPVIVLLDDHEAKIKKLKAEITKLKTEAKP